MKYMLLIHQADAPTPRDPEAWAALSSEEQSAVVADYQALNATPGVTPGPQLDAVGKGLEELRLDELVARLER